MLGLGQPAGPEQKAEHQPDQQSQAQRVRFGCHITKPHGVHAQTTQGSESTSSAYVQLGKGQAWDRGDEDGEAAAAARARGACPAWPLTQLQRWDLCVLPCPCITTRKYSQEGIIFQLKGLKNKNPQHRWESLLLMRLNIDSLCAALTWFPNTLAPRTFLLIVLSSFKISARQKQNRLGKN